jgi:hypothetical protein
MNTEALIAFKAVIKEDKNNYINGTIMNSN